MQTIGKAKIASLSASYKLLPVHGGGDAPEL